MLHHPRVSPKPAPRARTQQPLQLRLQLHTDIGVHGAAGLLLPLRGRAAGLLALVAIEPGISRQRAAALLWPDADTPRNNLRQQLLRFKQALGRALIEGEDALKLAPGVQLATAPPGAELLADETAGDDAFGHWLALQREREQQSRRAPLLQGLAEAEAAGDLEAALQHALALQQLAPDEEAAQATLMRLHYLRGEPAAGLAVFRRLQGLLLAQYGTQPAAATQQLADALARSGAVAPQPMPPATPLPVALKRPPVLAGRRAEQQAVQQAWAAGQAVLLEGEAGLGKSRLLAEFTAPQPGLLAAAGRPGDRGAPYATLTRLLRPLLNPGIGTLPAEAQRALAHIAPATTAQDPALRPGELQAAVADLLRAGAVHTLALDDLHFADDATLDLLAGLAAADTPVQHWLFAQRTAEASAAAQALRDALLELQRLAIVVLAPLDAAAATELVDALALPGVHGPAIALALVRHTGGNPLFLLETIKQGLLDGSLARGELPRPASVGALIERRLQRLSEPALALARVAAIAGVDFSIELAEATIGVRAVQLASAWDELQSAQVLRDESFAHDLVADAVLRGVPAVVGRRVHGQCATWLQAHGGEPLRLAWHWHHGGQPVLAALAFEQSAARAASAMRRWEEAELYQHAATAWAQAGRQPEQFEALASRVDALTRVDFGPVALQEAQGLHAQAQTDTQRLRAARSEIDLLANRGQAPLVIERGLQALELARRLNLPDEQLALSGPVAGCLTQLGRADEANTLLMALRPWIEAHAQPLQKQVWLGYLATALVDLGRLTESIQLREQQLAIAEQQGVAAIAVLAHNHIGVGHGAMGRPALAVQASRRAVRLCEDMPGDATRTALARATLARHLLDDAQFGEAIAILQEVQPYFESAGSRYWAEATALTLAAAWLRIGQPARVCLPQRDDEDLPRRLRAQRRVLQLELAQLGAPAPQPALADAARAVMNGDLGPALLTRVAALRADSDEAAYTEGLALAERLRRQERSGAEAAALVWHLRAATRLGHHDAACAAAHRVSQLLARDIAPEAMYRGEAYLHCWQTWAAAGQEAEAHAALQAGVAWVQQRALPHVPPAFVDAFLHRQPVNRSLLLAWRRTA